MPLTNKKIAWGVIIVLIILLITNLAFASSKTIKVQETELVKISTNTVDPDGDSVYISYSKPLNDQGKWQTNYGDAGEYNLEITASDGEKESTETIRLIVEKKNMAPFLLEKDISVKETQLVDLKSIVSDPDGDSLKFSFQPPFDIEGRWQTGYYDQGSYIAKFIVDDGTSKINAEVKIEVLNTNQPPTINNTFSASSVYNTAENETIYLEAKAVDQENSQLSYLWKLNNKTIGNGEKIEHRFGFDSAGRHKLELTVSDGELSASRQWDVEVKNTNRKPEINYPPLLINEGEVVELDLPEYDQDNEKITYLFSLPLNDQGIWETGFEDAGDYTAKISASDGELKVESEVKISVLGVDRPPTLEIPERLEVWEGGQLEWEIRAFDPDGDNISFSFTNAPSGSVFESNSSKLAWTPGYDIISRRGGFFSNLLNSLHLEKFFLKKRDLTMLVNACGKDLCTSKEAKITLFNNNRAPVIEPIGNITIKESEALKLSLKASDPDGDIIRYQFSSPLSRNGEWTPTHNSAGEYQAKVTVTDGMLETIVPLNIKVIKDNRAPNIKLKDDDFIVNEGQEIYFKVSVKDQDKDNVTISVKNPPAGASFSGGIFSWTPDYEQVTNRTNNWWNNLIGKYSFLNKKFNDEITTHWLEFSAYDGETETIHPVKVMVKNFNQGPIMVDYLPNTQEVFFVNEPVLFHVAVKDPDQDPLQFSWDFGMGQKEINGANSVERKFIIPGKKRIKVTVTDGRQEVEKEWKIIIVEKVNKEASLEAEKGGIKVYVIDTP